MTEVVWVANVGATSGIILGLKWPQGSQAAAELGTRSTDGEVIPAEDYPSRVVSDDYKARPKPIFNAGGLYAVTEPVAEILRGLEMGRNGLYPFAYLDQDGETPPPGGPFYFLNVCEMKTAVDVGRSREGLRESGHIRRPSVVAMPAATDAPHDTVRVLPSALIGPDIWMDTQMTQAIFFSDRFVRALRAAKLVKRIHFIRCPVLPASALH